MYKKMFITLMIFTFFNNSSFAQNGKQVQDTTITIKVKGVTCNNDLKTLSTNVKELQGVSECKPGKAGPVSVFKITYNPALVGKTEIFKAIENTGGCSDPNDRPYKVKTN